MYIYIYVYIATRIYSCPTNSILDCSLSGSLSRFLALSISPPLSTKLECDCVQTFQSHGAVARDSRVNGHRTPSQQATELCEEAWLLDAVCGYDFAT